ncbi:MAG: ImmA/IrrE family metallo-endopeptidase [Clostridiales bacterium]|jgi:antirestriction protein ArdC|nr:ImmA/IrrE family metallo-endopeptidase [Clostridiales bacterium]
MRSVDDILQELEEGVRKVYESGNYAEYLRMLSKFHRYSTSNNILIGMQRENCTMLAGYQSWKKNFGRTVKRGEKGIRIIVPFLKAEKKRDPKKKDAVGLGRAISEMAYDEVEIMRMKFKTAYVFDVSQTEGKPLPSIMEPTVGSVEDYKCMCDVMQMLCPVPVFYEDLDGESEGLYYFNDRIIIKPGMNEARTISALAHEIAHSILHKRPDVIDTRAAYSLGEVQAESVAYTFCQYFGIDTKCNSFGYIVDWSVDKTTKDLTDSLDVIRATASWLIRNVEELMAKYSPDDRWKTGDLPTEYMGKMAVKWVF